ncbi:hypothetical protein JRC04_05260 [Mycolicibacterium sp. S2-37]|uniref:RNA ligase family protein n=1 Tax=Mycolicibacterium sp. S2-37 TaxID=2810297 RepID=UPI001A94B19F|nr:RNA ligase family protein [Mycolicibacterium sp. S2-37]MBO0676863.1 hypothetical protein [Mycolicibacterium sp. S2-37]
MTFDPPKNINYAATVVRVPATLSLDGLDNLVGVPVLGHRALTQKVGVAVGDLKVAFTAETQLSHEYASAGNLYRESELNSDSTEKGYLEKNRRIRAIKMRGHRSDALLMPLDSLSFTGFDISTLKEGDTFDTLNGVEVCRKYEVPVKGSHGPKAAKLDKAFKRVDKKLFPEHLDTDAFWRSKHLLKPGREVVVTQKLHGTSIRVGRVPCLRQKGWFERLLNRWFPTTDYTYDAVFGSRKVIKDVNNPNQNHYYDTDIWTEFGRRIEDRIPEGFIVYGELIGWTPDNAAIQKNYTYNLGAGQAELYVYRVATINAQGTLADLSWDGVKEFCLERGLKWAPEMGRFTFGIGDEGSFVTIDDFAEWLDENLMDKRYADLFDENGIADQSSVVERPVPLSTPKTVDEGVCLRQEGVVPTILKAKSPVFLQHETKLLDNDEADLESAA